MTRQRREKKELWHFSKSGDHDQQQGSVSLNNLRKISSQCTTSIPEVLHSGKPHKDSHKNGMSPKYAPKLEPITKTKTNNKLPPLRNSLGQDNLNDSRLPNIRHSSKQTLPQKDQVKSHDNSRIEARLPESSLATENSAAKCRDNHCEKVFPEKQNISIGLDKCMQSIDRYQPTQIGSGYGQPFKLQKADEKPEWYDEREKLRRYKKKTEGKLTLTSLKPIKAVKVFHGNKVEGTKANNNRLLGNVQDHRQSQGWNNQDAHKDRVIGITASGRTTCTPPLSTDQPRACMISSFRPRGTVCSSKQGLGFRSKSHLAKLKEEEEKKMERERKEREQLEAKIPAQIRKGFKKYGFK